MHRKWHLPLWASTAAALAIGYWDLIRGGITLGPIALVIAYCVLMPLAIWGGRDPAAPAEGQRALHPSWRAALGVGAAIFVLYLLTLSPTTAMWDTSEYIAAAYGVGIPHPPGNPLFVLIGRVFALLPIAPTVAMRINILAALCSAASAALWFLVAERILSVWLESRWQRLVGAAGAAVIGATAFTVWNQSVVNEKVYTVSLLGIALVSWLMLRWADEREGGGARLLVLVAYLLGLGYTNHMASLMAAPAAGLLVLAVRPRTLLRWRLLLVCVAAFTVGMTVFATQPIRAAYAPAINEGEPTACVEGQGFRADCTFTATTWERFKYNFNREQYGKPSLAVRQAPFSAQLGMWWHYFKWQWLRDAHVEAPAAQAMLAALFLVLGLYGGLVHFNRDRRTFWYFGTLVVTMSVLLVYYMNFKYGHSQAPSLGVSVPREVRDRDYFFIWSYSAWGVWAAIGLVAVWETVAAMIHERTGRRGDAPPETSGDAARAAAGSESRERRSWLLASPVLAIALIPLATNWSTASRAGHTDARDFALDLLNSVEPYAVLIVAGDNDTFPLWYAQEVEGVRRDVLIVNNMLLNTDWHLRHVVRRADHEYDAATGPALYRGRTWEKPAERALRMTIAEADSLAPATPVTQRMTLRRNGIEAVVDPANLPQAAGGVGYLDRADVAILRIIADSWPQRPVYFSRTVGDQAVKLGLQPYLITQGFARKLVPSPAAIPSAVETPDGWMDVDRTERLWNEVFRGHRGLIARGDWVDRASVSIPFIYVATGLQLAGAQQLSGRMPDARATFETTRSVAKAVRLDHYLSSGAEAAP